MDTYVLYGFRFVSSSATSFRSNEFCSTASRYAFTNEFKERVSIFFFSDLLDPDTDTEPW
jgi:hypothetical protein